MKKLFIATLLLLSTTTIFAQLDTKTLAKEYDDMFILAQRVAEQTDKVVADEEKGVGFKKSSGTILLEKALDKRSNVNAQYLFKLVKSDGKKIPLDKVPAEKVIKKFNSTLVNLEAKLKEQHAEEVEDLLNSLLNGL